MEKQKIGLVGLAVMGENLALNIEEKGFPIAVYNRTTDKVDEFVAAHAGQADRRLPRRPRSSSRRSSGRAASS